MGDINFVSMLKPKTTTIRLSQFVHHRWTVPIIAELHASDGSKFVTLVNRLKLSKDSLSRTLEVLIEQGWVMRNPGYGHPLRPEYLLTPTGMLLGDACLRLVKRLREQNLEDIALRKWSLPVVFALAQGTVRFSEILQVFPGITTRAVALALKDLQAAGLVEETAPGYSLSATGQELRPYLEVLAEALEAG